MIGKDQLTNRPDVPGERCATRATPELVQRIEKIVAAMEPVTREVFLLHRIDAWPYPRIALALGLEVAGVEQHIAEAIVALDRGLRRHGL